jgi:hypothetical protein
VLRLGGIDSKLLGKIHPKIVEPEWHSRGLPVDKIRLHTQASGFFLFWANKGGAV